MMNILLFEKPNPSCRLTRYSMSCRPGRHAKNLGPNSTNNEASSDVSSELEEEKIDEDEDVTEVKKLTIDGVDYLVDNENTVYDMETQDEIGCYNPETNSIVRDEL